MDNQKPIILIGCRQDNYAVKRAIESMGRTIVGIADRFYLGQTKDEIPVVASDLDLLDENSWLFKNRNNYDWFVSTIFTGATEIKNSNHNSWLLRNERVKIADYAKVNLINVIHSNSYVDPLAVLGKNIYVGWGTYIGANCKIGNFNFFAYNCGLPHHISTGDLCTFAGTTTFVGNTVVGNNVFAGPGVVFSRTSQCNVVVGNNVIIAPGSIIMRSIASDKIYFANGKTLNNQHFTL